MGRAVRTQYLPRAECRSSVAVVLSAERPLLGPDPGKQLDPVVHARIVLALSRRVRYLCPPLSTQKGTMRRPYLLLLAVAAFACRPADTSASAKQAIDSANAQWGRLTSTGHADSIADFYAANAVLMPPNMATVKGKEAIRGFFAVINTMKPL